MGFVVGAHDGIQCLDNPAFRPITAAKIHAPIPVGDIVHACFLVRIVETLHQPFGEYPASLSAR